MTTGHSAFQRLPAFNTFQIFAVDINQPLETWPRGKRNRPLPVLLPSRVWRNFRFGEKSLIAEPLIDSR
jgi:hypothetical protein